MKLLNLTKISLLLNLTGIGLPLYLHWYQHGMNANLVEVVTCSCIGGVAMYLWSKNSARSNPLIALLEKPESVVDSSPLESTMTVAIMLVPITFGLISVTAIANYDDGLASVHWMIIAMAVNTGTHLEAMQRLMHSR